MPSYRDINYSVRPAKAVERKMMVEAFRRLHLSWPLDTYRYVGMGSIYFADFQLVHEQLGISDMISLELEGQPKARFDFNRPYACIKMEYRKAEVGLPKLPWDKPSIIWFDYDGKLNSQVISDFRTVVQNAKSGTVICLSVNIEADRPPESISPEERDSWRLAEFSKNVGEENLPAGLIADRLRAKLLGAVVREILTNALQDQLAKRNGRSDIRPDTMMAQQVFNFKYSDDAKMLTLGWLIHSVADCSSAEKCGFNTLPYTRSSADAFAIQAPKLTRKEVRYFASHLPHGNPTETFLPPLLSDQTGVPESDIQRYRDVYRYYPSYAEVGI